MTPNQVAFDQVAAHLLAQNAKAMADLGSGHDGCVYLDPTTGHKCAVGCLIPPDRYRKEMEGKVPGHIQGQYGLFTDVDERLLNSLQGVHDDYHPDEWKEQLYAVGQVYDLTAKF